MTLSLVTTGHVQGWIAPHGARQGYAGPNRILWSDLDAFTQGYIEAMFDGWAVAPQIGRGDAWDWALTDMNDAEWWCDDKPADAPDFRAPAFSDLAPETLSRIIADCRAAREGYRAANTKDCGASFWAGRNDPGGCWQYLVTDGFPPLTVQLDDDGRIRFEA